ncbi:S41 family peptidase [Pedobacter sp. P351]|uniref:S41 family peptidase n=1 Tax=Pedobacter superstes TaxID=3133441 RepID=UPI00309EFC73
MQSSTKSNLFVASCYAGILALGMAVGPKFGHENNTSLGSFVPFISGEKTEKVEQVLRIIKENYVDPVTVDTLQNLAINQILSHLDPHSLYLPPIKARDQSQSLEGNYSGIGIEYLILNDTILVTSVKNGPAQKAGIRAGDKILQIENKLVAGRKITTTEIVSLIKGRTGTSVKLLVKKRNSQAVDSVSIMRDRITISSIDAAYMIAPTVAYVKISKFGAHTDEDFLLEISRLQQSNMKNLILDLRNNGGGYLSAATALADEFLPEKQLIVYTKGEHEPRTDYFATKNGKFEQGKLVVLIDETTASASEVVAGAVQDLGRGVVIGRRSFGKGLVQEQFNFGDGSALNLTIARYYTPLGRSIQRPYKMSSEAYFAEASTRLENNELNTDGTLKDSLFDKSQVYKTASGHVLYGGGGIMPDIYIPVDTSAYNSFFYALRARGLLTEFLFSQIVNNYHPVSLKQLLTDFKLSDEDYQRLISIAVKKGVKVSPKASAVARKAVNKEIKASLAKFYFEDESYYKVVNSSDEAISRSLQEMK